MRLVLALPQLLALDPALLAGLPGLARIAAMAGTPERAMAGIDAAFARLAGAPVEASLAQLAAAGAGIDPRDAPVLFADPVTLIAGRDDVLLGGRVDDLSAADAQVLVTALNAHFTADGIAFHAPRADAWFLTGRPARGLATTPLAAVRGALLPYLPRGDAAKSWRRWLSEMQMLLHEHPVNAARERAGRAPVTGVWIWGGGDQAWTAPPPDAAWFAPPGRAGDVARGLARRVHRDAAMPPASMAALPPAAAVHAVLPPAVDADAVAALDAAWLAPAAAALMRGAIASIALVADAGGPAFQWRAGRPAWTVRLRHRWAAAPFVVPAVDDDI